MGELRLMKGNEAIAEAAIRCGVDGYFGYPITPQSEIMETLMELRPWETSGMVVLQAESNPRFGSLSGYFRWSFAEDRFTLWQRTDYNSTMCFSHRILDLPFGVLAAKDNGKETEFLN